MEEAAIGTDQEGCGTAKAIAHGKVGFWAGIAVNPVELVLLGVGLRDFHGVIEAETNDGEASVFAPGGLRGFERLQFFFRLSLP